MKRSISVFLVMLFSIVSFGQSFEGKIVYQNTYKSKLPNLTDAQFTKMMGMTQEYYIKDGGYKSVSNGALMQWQLYVSKDNKLYNKMATSETLLWIDCASNSDEVLKAEINKGVTEILGYKCDEIILTCKSGTQKYYYNATLSIDPKLYVNHKFGNWFDLISRTNSLPLKTIVDNGQFSLESIASEIKEIKLEKEIFELPAGAKSVKSPY